MINSCQKLESIGSIGVNCGESYLSESDLLQTVAKCSPKNFFKLGIILEPVFTSSANRIPRKSLYLILDYPDGLKVKKESMETIGKFKTLCVIKIY